MCAVYVVVVVGGVLAPASWQPRHAERFLTSGDGLPVNHNRKRGERKKRGAKEME